MESQWTNKLAILRDLSFAQGRKIPAEIVDSFVIRDKPPASIIKEIEDEYSEPDVADGGLHTKPDLDMIKHMLDVVRELDVDDLCDGNTDSVIEISKANVENQNFLRGDVASGGGKDGTHASNAGTTAKTLIETKTRPRKKQRDRNVALTSLLEKEKLKLSLSENLSVDKKIQETPATLKFDQNNDRSSSSTDIKLLKPNDFMKEPNAAETAKKASVLLQSSEESSSANLEKLNVSATNMFKKKKRIAPVLESGSMFKRKIDTNRPEISATDTSQVQANNVFVPSTHASEYYQKYLERSQVKVQGTIWEEAERTMKKIEANIVKNNQRQLNLGRNTISNSEEDKASLETTTSIPSRCPQLDARGWDLVGLPVHRHELAEECKVCLVLCKQPDFSQ